MTDTNDVGVCDDIWRPNIRIFLHQNGNYKHGQVFDVNRQMDWNDFLRKANGVVQQTSVADRLYSIFSSKEIVTMDDVEDDCHYVLVPRGQEFKIRKRTGCTLL